jgi:ADP-heptose:LPS heptosyltransferase
VREAWLVRLGGLGDLLVALPAIRLVRCAYAQTRLRLVGRPEYGLILKEAGVVDEVSSADEARWAQLFSDFPKDHNGFDRPGQAFVWFHSRESARISRNLQALLPKADIGAFRADPAGRVPLSHAFFEATARFLRARGLETASFEGCLQLPVGKEQRSRGRASLGGPRTGRRFAVVHPGSGSSRKCWPLARFLGLIPALAAEGFDGLVVTGEAEGRLEGDLGRTVLPDGWTWRPCPSLSDLARWLALTDIYLGNDSGVTHLAAACGAAVVALFGEEFEAAWRPAGDVHLLSAPDVALIPAEAVLAKIFAIFS